MDQPNNRNYLSPIGFKFMLDHAPKVDFFCNSANIPGINLGVAVQPNYLKMIDHPGDMLTFEDLTLSFLVDEDLENYMEIWNWMTALGFPESIEQFIDYQDQYKKGKFTNNFPEQADATLQILNSNYRPAANVKFRGVFPFSLTTLQFDARERDYTYFTANVTFKYTMYNITDILGTKL